MKIRQTNFSPLGKEKAQFGITLTLRSYRISKRISLTDPTGWDSFKFSKDAKKVDAPLVMVSIGARTLTGKTVYQNGSTDVSLDSTRYL
jgi:hypothetical protein